MSARAILGPLHRWAGLLTAAFLVFSGVTGAIISWDHQLDEWLNSHLEEVTTNGPARSSIDLAKLVEERDPHGRVTFLATTPEPGHSLWFWVEPRIDPATGNRYPLDYNQVYLDPNTGKELGRRYWGAVWPLSRENFVSSLQAALHPAPSRVLGQRPLGHAAAGCDRDHLDDRLLRRLLPDAAIETAGGGGAAGSGGAPACPRVLGALEARLENQAVGDRLSHKLRYPSRLRPVDLGRAIYHRLHGVFAQSELGSVLAADANGVELHADAVRTADTDFARRSDRSKTVVRRIIAKASAEGRARGWDTPVGGVFHGQQYGFYDVRFYHPGDDHGAAGVGPARLFYDSQDGRLIGDRVPWVGTAADVFVQLQFPLHSGRILGLPGRILISAMGLVVAALSITGVVIWYRKRRARLLSKARSQGPSRRAGACPRRVTT